MAASGFEGFEKRIELHFFGDDPLFTGSMGLRNLDFECLEEILHAVQCTVVSAVANRHFDAYVLSESSLFVYPTKIIIKTCGTTQLLKSVSPLVHLASDRLGLTVRMCRYTRGSFIFPKAQPFPHTSFEEEVIFLEENLPSRLCFRKACVMPSNVSSHSWHVFTACDSDDDDDSSHHHELGEDQSDGLYTIEVCMTELDRTSARKFFRRGGGDDEKYSGDSAGREMTGLTGIGDINPRALICDFGFDPCGYSMNGIDGDRYSTIHVTPEEGFSYASYECVGSIYDDPHEISRVLKKVAHIFRAGTVSVATTCASHEVWRRVAKTLELVGLKCRSCSADEFPAAGTVVFQTFTTTRRK